MNKKTAKLAHKIYHFYATHENILLPIFSVTSFLILWEVVPNLGLVKPLFTSSPSRIWTAAQWLWENGLWHDMQVSGAEFGIGYFLAVIIAIPSGICLGWYKRLNAIFDPFISVLNATPRIAIFPLLMLWLGIGIESKIAVIFLGALFPILINVITSMRTIDQNLLKCARSFGSNDYQILITLALPSSIPFIIAGMRLAVGRALVGVVVGEFVASNAGIGYMMRVASGTFQTDKVFVGLVILSGTGYILTECLKKLEARFERWRPLKS